MSYLTIFFESNLIFGEFTEAFALLVFSSGLILLTFLARLILNRQDEVSDREEAIEKIANLTKQEKSMEEANLVKGTFK